MPENETSGQETDAPTDDQLAAKRARFEAFEFRVPTAGRVRVENTSYGDESDEHVYVVEVAEHVGATACTCASDEYRATACKHRRAVESADAVMLAATEGLSGAFPERDANATESSVETHAIAADGGQVGDGESGDDDDTTRERPTRSEPADFGGGDASGMDEL